MMKCPQGCGEVECSWPQIVHENTLPSWRCPHCSLRFIVTNPSYLDKGTEIRLSVYNETFKKSDPRGFGGKR